MLRELQQLSEAAAAAAASPPSSNKKNNKRKQMQPLTAGAASAARATKAGWQKTVTSAKEASQQMARAQAELEVAAAATEFFALGRRDFNTGEVISEAEHRQNQTRSSY